MLLILWIAVKYYIVNYSFVHLHVLLPWHSSTIKLIASAQRTFIALRRPLIDILSVDKPWTNHGQTMDNSKEKHSFVAKIWTISVEVCKSGWDHTFSF